MRVRCDRGVQERPCEGAVRPRQPCASVPPSHFENFRQAWQKCVAKFGNARPRPKQDKYVLPLSGFIGPHCISCQILTID